MTSRHRTTSSSRKDSYSQWRPSDSDSDRPRQTMVTTQRHNVDQILDTEASRKHRSSRRAEAADPQDPSTSYSRHHHKSSSRDRSSSAQHASYYAVPSSPNPSQYQTQDAYYDLRAHLDLKRKTDKRSPRSREKALAGDEVKVSRSGHRSSSQAYPTTAQHTQAITHPQYYAQAIVPPQPYAVPAQATRDPTSSSRHHREREKDREKPGNRDPDKVKVRDPTETREEREKRKKREKDGEKGRTSKDKERHKEKDRHKDRETRAASGPADATSVYHAYAQTMAPAQRSADRIPASYPEYIRTAQVPSSAYPSATASVAMPWSGLTSAGHGAAAPVLEPIYPYASDKEDPPLPIPPPEHRRERTSSKPHRSHHHKVSSQHAGQDSGFSSSEQEQHSVLERPRVVDKHLHLRDQTSVLQRDQGSVFQRGYSSGPSGSENEKAPTVQKERRKHRTHGESSRHKSKNAGVDVQPVNEPTTSQEIANAWYTRHQSSSKLTSAVDPSTQKSTIALAVPAQSSVHPSGKPASSVGLTASQRTTPRIVSIRAGQGPADPQTSTVLQKILHGTTPTRHPDPLPTHTHTTGHGDAHGYLQSSANTGATGPYQPSAHSYSNAALSHSRHPETNGITHGNQLAVPEVVVRPPSTAPAPVDPYTPRAAASTPQANAHSGSLSGRVQVPESRIRSIPVAQAYPAGYTQLNAQSGTYPGTVLPDADPHHSTSKGPSQDLPSRFPVYEDATAVRPAAALSNASPRRGLTYPGASAPAPVTSVHVNPLNYQGQSGYGPRSPKPPSVSTITPDTARLQPSSGSPAVVAHAVSAGSSTNTPRHSPSGRLHSHRNGSNDTITHGVPTKPSPTGSSQQQLSHRTSATIVQPHASSRPDSTTARQPNVSSAYPDITRYRSPAPSGYPNANTSSAAPIHSQAYSTQTPLTSYDNQYGRFGTGQTQAAYSAHPSTTQGYGRPGQSLDHGLRVQDPGSAYATSSAAAPSAQRVSPRSAPSPAPTVRPLRLAAVSSPSSRIPAPLHSAPPVPSRNQTFPTPASTHINASPFPAHARTISDPQHQARVGAYASLPARGHVPPRAAPSPAPQNDVLLTPSSLAPSMLPPTASTVPLSRTTSKSTTKEKEKKKGFFGLSLFRSRSSPPKERAVDAPGPAASVREKRERKNSQPTQPQAYAQAPATGNKIAASQDNPRVAVAAELSIPAQSQHSRGYSTSAVPIAAPTPVLAPAQRTSNGKMFTPFRLLSKRHRTVSTASVEAVDGTVLNAMLTGGDSTRSSTAGRPSPPLRDPMMAAQEWRNKEENEQQGRGTLRRRRPGVTFEVGDGVPEEGRGPLQKSLRQNLQLQSSTSQVPAPIPARQATA